MAFRDTMARLMTRVLPLRGLPARMGLPPHRDERPARPGANPLDNEIIDAIDPWMLASAVGAENGSIGVRYGFPLWLRQSRANWMPALKQKLDGIDEDRIIRALGEYVFRNRHKDYRTVLNEETRRRGLPDALTIGPGESITIGEVFPSLREPD